jgi:type IV pilus assembly protein PilA
MSYRRFQLRAPRSDDEKGFTLIELLVVVVIIGILIAIAIPVYLSYEKGAKDKSAQSDLHNAVGVLELCNSDNQKYPTAIGTLTNNAYSTLAGCTGQKLTVSSGTTLAYTSPTGNASYILHGNNSGGSGKWYCYNSLTGGGVSTVASATTAC